MEQIKYFLPALRAECLKMKNTLGIWTSLIFPFLVVFMNFMIYFNRPKMIQYPEVNPWLVISNNAVMMYSLLFLPIFIAIITFYVNYNEHKSNAWRQIYALPVPKGSVYVAKLFVSVAIVCTSMIFFYSLNYFSMILLKTLLPAIPFARYAYDSIIAITFFKITLASLGIIAIQFVISIMSGNFIYPLGFGLVATFAGVFLIQWENIIYYPYSFPFRAAMGLTKHNYDIINQNTIFSIITAAVFITAGYFVHFRVKIK
jgi:lantibiotic transport system permease protein